MACRSFLELARGSRFLQRFPRGKSGWDTRSAFALAWPVGLIKGARENRFVQRFPRGNPGCHDFACREKLETGPQRLRRYAAVPCGKTQCYDSFSRRRDRRFPGDLFPQLLLLCLRLPAVYGPGFILLMAVYGPRYEPYSDYNRM